MRFIQWEEGTKNQIKGKFKKWKKKLSKDNFKL